MILDDTGRFPRALEGGTSIRADKKEQGSKLVREESEMAGMYSSTGTESVKEKRPGCRALSLLRWRSFLKLSVFRLAEEVLKIYELSMFVTL